MVTREEIVRGLRGLGLDKDSSIIVHASLKSFGEVEGGAQGLVKALREACGTILAPAFTWQTIYYPEGWEKNPDCPSEPTPEEILRINAGAEAYHPGLRTTPLVGIVPEIVRQEPDSKVGWHPTHRFAAVGPDAERLVRGQAPMAPLEPIAELRGMGGWILLLGVGHTSSTAIHLAEAEAGRRQWHHWALTRHRGVVECITPSCSRAFGDAEPVLEEITRETTIGQSRVRLLPLGESLERVKVLIRRKPDALLCGECLWCRKAALATG